LIEQSYSKITAESPFSLFSGDADFVPAVHLLKAYSMRSVNLHPYAGSSTELRTTCQKHILIDFDADGPVLIVGRALGLIFKETYDFCKIAV